MTRAASCEAATPVHTDMDAWMLWYHQPDNQLTTQLLALTFLVVLRN